MRGGGAEAMNDGREEKTSDGGNAATTDCVSTATVISSCSAATTEDDGAATKIGYGYPTVFSATHSRPHAASSGIHDKKRYTRLLQQAPGTVVVLHKSTPIVGVGIFPSTRGETNLRWPRRSPQRRIPPLQNGSGTVSTADNVTHRRPETFGCRVFL